MTSMASSTLLLNMWPTPTMLLHNDILTVVGLTAQLVQRSRQVMQCGAGSRGGG